jgi:hypothetical protein
MITYLIELTALLRHRAVVQSRNHQEPYEEEEDDDRVDDSEAERDDKEKDDGNDEEARERLLRRRRPQRQVDRAYDFGRLVEVKTALDKMRGLDQKLRYQIDKLLATVAQAEDFGDGHNDASRRDDEKDANMEEADERIRFGRVNSSNYYNDDPLDYRPNMGAMLGHDDDDTDDDDDEDDDDLKVGDGDSDVDRSSSLHGHEDPAEAEEEDDDDEDIAAAKRTLEMARGGGGAKSRKTGDNRDNIGPVSSISHRLYRAPRLASVPYRAGRGWEGGDGDFDGDRRDEKERQRLRRLRASEIATALRSRYSDAPEVEDAGGGADLGRQREASRRWAEREKERTKYEESAFVRLAPSRKDKQLKKKLLREEMSNLGALADLGSLVSRGLEDDGDGPRKPPPRPTNNSLRYSALDGQDGEGRYSNGKRKRSGDGGTRKRGSTFRSTNSLQAALYTGGGGKSKKKGKR